MGAPESIYYADDDSDTSDDEDWDGDRLVLMAREDDEPQFLEPMTDQ